MIHICFIGDHSSVYIVSIQDLCFSSAILSAIAFYPVLKASSVLKVG